MCKCTKEWTRAGLEALGAGEGLKQEQGLTASPSQGKRELSILLMHFVFRQTTRAHPPANMNTAIAPNAACSFVARISETGRPLPSLPFIVGVVDAKQFSTRRPLLPRLASLPPLGIFPYACVCESTGEIGARGVVIRRVSRRAVGSVASLSGRKRTGKLL